MSRYLLIASAVLLLASAALGFINKGKIAAKQADLDQTHRIAQAAQTDAQASKKKQATAEKAAADAQAKSNDLQSALTAATSQVTDLNNKIADNAKSIEDKDGQIAQLKDTIARTASNGVAKPADAGDASTKLQDMEMQLNELKTVREGLESQLKATQTQVASLQKREVDRSTGDMMRGLQGKVLAVNHDWNFVVLSLGGNRGVSNNATMVVQRGGSTVGRLRVTSVEPTQSIADIIPNSVPPGVIVQPGDTVFFSSL